MKWSWNIALTFSFYAEIRVHCVLSSARNGISIFPLAFSDNQSSFTSGGIPNGKFHYVVCVETVISNSKNCECRATNLVKIHLNEHADDLSDIMNVLVNTEEKHTKHPAFPEIQPSPKPMQHTGSYKKWIINTVSRRVPSWNGL